jgi:hypothetical protein
MKRWDGMHNEYSCTSEMGGVSRKFRFPKENELRVDIFALKRNINDH